MSDKAQTQLLTVFTLAIFGAMKGPLSNLFLTEKVPGKRGYGEDLTDAAMQGVVRSIAVVLASVLVRQLANQRR